MENYNVFAGAFVDRIGERRKDSAWLADALRSEQGRILRISCRQHCS